MNKVFHGVIEFSGASLRLARPEVHVVGDLKVTYSGVSRYTDQIGACNAGNTVVSDLIGVGCHLTAFEPTTAVVPGRLVPSGDVIVPLPRLIWTILLVVERGLNSGDCRLGLDIGVHLSAHHNRRLNDL